MSGFRRPRAAWLILCSALLLLPLAAARAAEPPEQILAGYRGQVTYLDFWASWCTPCAEAFPWLNEMQAKYGPQGLRVVGVGVDETPAKGDRFLKIHPPDFAILRDPDGTLAEYLGVAGMPYAVVLDAQGKVVHRHSGYRESMAGEYEQAIRAALAAGKAGGGR